jgi:hypothetical protein
MARFTELSSRGFWIGTAILFGVVFLINYNLYVMPDAFSVTLGTLLGSYLFAWIVWWVVKLIMKARAPERRYLVFLLACLSAAAVVARHLPGLQA